MEILEHINITIEGKHLSNAYGVYIIIIQGKNEESPYYYVGQTGDAKVISARSPFYRVAAHLGYRKSTQNQVYEGLKKSLKIEGENSRWEMEQWLDDKTINIHFFKTDEFKFLKEDDRSTHTKNRRKTLALETALLQELLVKVGKEAVLNKSYITYKKFEDEIPQAKKILKNLMS